MPIDLVAGLGNPGPRYAYTRHNLGFRVVELVARRWGGTWSESRMSAVARVTSRPALMKPLTFMNRSGSAVAAVMVDRGLVPEDVLVVVDDVDLPLGSLRLRPAGGPGTHNGMRDLCAHLGDGFARLRLGVRGEDPWDDLAAYVLEGFAGNEFPTVERMVAAAADAVELVCRDGIAAAMQQVNRRVTADAEPGPTD